MTHVSHESWETLPSSAKRATESLGGRVDKSNRFKPSQVIHHHEAFPFLTNQKIPTEEESFSCLFIYFWHTTLNISGRSEPEPWRHCEDMVDTAVLSSRPGCSKHGIEKCGKIPGSLKSTETFPEVSIYACFHKLTKNTFLSDVQSLNPTCFWECACNDPSSLCQVPILCS